MHPTTPCPTCQTPLVIEVIPDKTGTMAASIQASCTKCKTKASEPIAGVSMADATASKLTRAITSRLMTARLLACEKLNG